KPNTPRTSSTTGSCREGRGAVPFSLRAAKLNQRELAKLLNVTPATISAYRDRGLLSASGGGPSGRSLTFTDEMCERGRVVRWLTLHGLSLRQVTAIMSHAAMQKNMKTTRR